ncbi:sulfite exporter TauE/SafE family protein [Pedobacter sp. PWIIR3]
MVIVGFVACALIGISLGLIGAGGSILMVPVLVFLFHMPPLIASSYSLFVVGATSMFSAAGKFHKGDVLLGSALAFGITSMAAVLTVRHFIIPLIPRHLGMIGHADVSYDLLSMLLFGLLMIVAAVCMVNKTSDSQIVAEGQSGKMIKMVSYALLVGCVTGFLGAGGGFLIIPVMTLLLGIDMKKAVGTSLAVVALNSLSGFANDLSRIDINWSFLSMITLIALGGSISGGLISSRINVARLKACFAWFVLSLGITIITAECYGFLRAVYKI